jgi:hypothetical protein
MLEIKVAYNSVYINFRNKFIDLLDLLLLKYWAVNFVHFVCELALAGSVVWPGWWWITLHSFTIYAISERSFGVPGQDINLGCSTWCLLLS